MSAFRYCTICQKKLSPGDMAISSHVKAHVRKGEVLAKDELKVRMEIMKNKS